VQSIHSPARTIVQHRAADWVAHACWPGSGVGCVHLTQGPGCSLLLATWCRLCCCRRRGCQRAAQPNVLAASSWQRAVWHVLWLPTLRLHTSCMVLLQPPCRDCSGTLGSAPPARQGAPQVGCPSERAFNMPAEGVARRCRARMPPCCMHSVPDTPPPC
jgi:hypothetical protein